MNKPAVKHAIAVAVVAAVVFSLFESIVPCSPGIVQAEEKKAEEKKAEEKTEQAGLGFTCRERRTHQQAGLPTPFETLATLRVSPEFGSRKDTYEQGKVASSEYRHYADGTTITLYHLGMRAGTYTRQEGPKGPPAPGQGYDPRPRIKKALAGEHKDLGRRTIDGVQAEGTEAHETSAVTGMSMSGSMSSGAAGSAPSVTAQPYKIEVATVRQFWSGVETGCPVLVEENVAATNGAFRQKTILDRFRWNVRVDPNEFKAKIPPDYRLVDERQLGQMFGGGSGGFRRGPASGPAATPQSQRQPRRQK
ncbi:MAG: hypothetical protein ABFE01_28435 [Phycisphaerales bacterium]